MAIGYQHPKVQVNIEDGFKFLESRQNEFDVIITDSSDPEGPAESLFQKPYFELLYGALKEGGVISTQGCTFFLAILYTNSTCELQLLARYPMLHILCNHSISNLSSQSFSDFKPSFQEARYLLTLLS